MIPSSLARRLPLALTTGLGLIFLTVAAGAQVSPVEPPFLRQFGIRHFSPQVVEAFEAFFRAEEKYGLGDYEGAGEVLDTLWSRFPPGGPSWGALPRTPFGLNLGSPPLYYGLRMLTDMTNWRRGGTVRTLQGRRRGTPSEFVQRGPRTVVFTVVVLGETTGVEPRTLAELNQGSGISAQHALDARVRADDYKVIHQSLTLFREYVLALTDGQLQVEVRVHPLLDASQAVEARVTSEGRFVAGLVDYSQVWSEVSAEIQEETDWWWILYPSHVPEQYPDFTTAEFVTGGMGGGPDGSSPCFIIDDRWLVRKPPHLGRGPYSEVEREIYLPQWLQHEFFHHLFREYRSLGLEDIPHQWFDRSTWPADFVGIYEPDYYHEAIYNRLRFAEPPLEVSLRYATAGAPWEALVLDDVLGSYRREPVENPWHLGTIHRGPGGEIRWSNTAGVSWRLVPDLINGVLLTGPDCPYYDPPNGTMFDIVLVRDDRGDLTAEIEGYAFNHETYRRR